MPMLNFEPFDVVEMTDAINKLPLMPMRLSGLFAYKSVKTTSVALDLKKGRITLVEHQDRSAPAQSLAGKGSKRSVKTLQTAHLPQSDVIHPEDIQNVRAFGSNQPTSAVTVVNEKMQTIKNNVTMTKEMHRLGAVKGIVYDADGETELHNLFDVFECTQKKLNVTFPTTVSVKDNAILKSIFTAKRHVEAQMGGVPFGHLECLVGADFYDALTGHELVRKVFEDWLSRRENFGDNDYRRRGFFYGGVMFYEASDVVAGRTLVDTDKGHLYPVGSGIFTEYSAPANWMETVNTYGQPFYARMDVEDNGRGYYIEGQANPLMLCNFPEALVELKAV